VRFLLPLVLVAASNAGAAELMPETDAAWERYVELTEERIERELTSADGFLVQDFLPDAERSKAVAALSAGEVFATKFRTLEPDGRELEVPFGLVHHWVGSIFVPGADVQSLVAWLQDYDEHERYFDDVEESRLIARQGESFDIFLRLKRKKIVTVHYATEHAVQYRRHGADRISSRSRATRIAEIEDPGTPREREKPAGQDRGFLWRLNSYWRFEQRPGGVVVELESISLSRGVPLALRWLIGPYLDSVPRESLEATLAPIRLRAGARPSCIAGASSRRCDSPRVRPTAASDGK
jgi:hypothetical protein